MQLRNLGRSGLRVSVVGLGCNNFGGRIDLEASRAVIHRAIDKGITLFDTADIYGNRGGSETVMGQILGDRRKEIVLATKFGMNMDDAGVKKGGSRRWIMTAVEDSLRRLKTDWIDLYQIHRHDPHTPIEETLRAMDDLVRQGKVRYVGCSNFAAWQVVEAQWTAKQVGSNAFVSCQDEYSLLVRGLEKEQLPAMQAYGLGLLPYFPLACGLLTGKYRQDLQPEGARLTKSKDLADRYMTDANWAIVEKLRAFCDARGKTLLELAMSWLACRPTVASVIAGATKPEQIDQNVSAAGWALSEADMAEIDRLIDGRLTIGGRTLRFVLGDQLSAGLSALRGADPSLDVVLMVEVAEETTYVAHHKKKIAFVLAAMRAFAGELREGGFAVDYVRLDEPANTGSFTGELRRAVERHRPERIVATEASEWRVLEMQRRWAEEAGLAVDLREDDRFLCTKAEFGRWAAGRKQLRMEYFYRDMRRKTCLLMDGDQPLGGRWNFDAENRKPAAADLFMPSPLRFPPSPTTKEVLSLVGRRFADNFGALEPFWFPVTREDAEAARDQFLEQGLPRFGDFQDAMLRDQRFLYHSLLSAALNVGLLDPLDLCRRAELEFHAGRAPLNAVEGFVRQIIGWREYVRGIYWLTMPGYPERNALDARRPLPWMYWSGETDMACMAAVIGQTKEEAYAHHIQRLMVTGNFALLAGIDPFALHEWYLAVYVDAFEWVEAPNTVGMSQFADGGLLGSKPYAASGAYIDRMSDYCGACRYRVNERTGDDACPLNALYWDFLARHRRRFENHPRMAQMYRTYDKLAPDLKAAMAERAATFLDRLDRHGTDRPQP